MVCTRSSSGSKYASAARTSPRLAAAVPSSIRAAVPVGESELSAAIARPAYASSASKSAHTMPPRPALAYSADARARSCGATRQQSVEPFGLEAATEEHQENLFRAG